MSDWFENCMFFPRGGDTQDVIAVYPLPEDEFLVAETNGPELANVKVSKHRGPLYEMKDRNGDVHPFYALRVRGDGEEVLLREEPEKEIVQLDKENVEAGVKDTVRDALEYWVKCFDYPSGKVLYKYYPPRVYHFDAVLSGRFFFSKAYTLNDPFDTSFNVVRPFTGFLEKTRVSPQAENIMDSYGTCSFSEEPNNKHLWALYADSYTGFVVGYDKSKLDNLGDLLTVRCPLRPVVYRNELFNLDDDSSSFSLLVEDGIQTFTLREAIASDKTMDRLWEYLCLVKEKPIWENEKEWRYFVGQDVLRNDNKQIEKRENGYLLPIPEGAVKEIIVGHNITPENFGRMCEIAVKYKVAKIMVTRPTTRNKNFEVEIVDRAFLCMNEFDNEL